MSKSGKDQYGPPLGTPKKDSQKVLRPLAQTHSWFIWFRRGMSLKFPKWFMFWFIDFGPILEFFPKEVLEIYQYFKNVTTFEQGYRLISFIVSQGITWIMSWNYIYEEAYDNCDLKTLSRQIKIKWWKKFNIELLNKKKIEEWAKSVKISQEEKRKVSSTEKQQEVSFLSEKQKIMAELAAATSPEEFEEKLKTVCNYQDSIVTIMSDSSAEGSPIPYHYTEQHQDSFNPFNMFD